jgi:hypothetical protein
MTTEEVDHLVTMQDFPFRLPPCIPDLVKCLWVYERDTKAFTMVTILESREPVALYQLT